MRSDGFRLLVVLTVLGSAGCGCGGRTTMSLVGGKPGTVYDGGSHDAGLDHKQDVNAWGGAGGGPGDTAGSGQETTVGGTGDTGSGGGRPVTGGAGGGAAGNSMTGAGGGNLVRGGSAAGGTMMGGRGGVVTGLGGLPSGGTGAALSAAGGLAAGAIGGGTGSATGGTGGGLAGSGGGGATAGWDGGSDRDGGGPVDQTGKPPLWRSSYDRFCEKTDYHYAGLVSVWSDHRGVFLLVHDTYHDLPPTIRSNTGAGWQTSYTWPSEVWMYSVNGGLRGIVDGPLIAFGILPCTIQLVDGTGASCSGAPSRVQGMVVVNPTLAYAVSDREVLRFDGSLWTQLGDPLPNIPSAQTRPMARAIWADSSIAVVVANEGGVYFIDPSSGQVTLQDGLPGSHFGSVWGFGSKDIWIGSDAGELYHYDGNGWSLAWSTGDSAIIRLWGSEGVLFVASWTTFAQWDGNRFLVLDSVTSEGMYTDLWGNSPKEVFITVDLFHDEDCGPYQLRWFNGSVVGPL
jgi:hypothetical protein